MAEKDPKSTLSKDIPTGDRAHVQAGDYSPDGLRGGPPPPDAPGPSPISPSVKDVATGSMPGAHPLEAYDAPDGDKTI